MKSWSKQGGRHRRGRWTDGVTGPASALLVLFLCLFLGYASIVVSTPLLLGGGVAVLLGCLFLSQQAVLLLVLPLAFAAWRVPLIPQGISVADVALALAVCVVLAHGLKLPPLGERILRAVLIYQSLLLIVVLLHPTAAAAVEWAHRFFLMAGALVVGAALAQAGRGALALRVFAIVCVVVGGVASIQAVVSGFAPVYPLGLPKNLAGEVLAAGVLVVVAVGRSIFASSVAVVFAGGSILAGLMATQSRGAWVGLAVALLIWSVYARPSIRVVFAMGLVAAAGAVYVITSLAAESELENSQQTSSLESRQYFEDVAFRFFSESPISGQGIRYYLDPAFDFPIPLSAEGQTRPSPHNVLVETLSESGVIGSVAFALLIALTVVALLRQRTPMAMLALSSFAGNLTHGTVDIYWLAGSLTIPWILIGLASGLSDRELGRFGERLAKPPYPAGLRSLPIR